MDASAARCRSIEPLAHTQRERGGVGGRGWQWRGHSDAARWPLWPPGSGKHMDGAMLADRVDCPCSLH